MKQVYGVFKTTTKTHNGLLTYVHVELVSVWPTKAGANKAAASLRHASPTVTFVVREIPFGKNILSPPCDPLAVEIAERHEARVMDAITDNSTEDGAFLSDEDYTALKLALIEDIEKTIIKKIK